MIPVLLPVATDAEIRIGVRLGVLCPVPMTVKVGTEGVDIDWVAISVEEGASSTVDSEPGPVPIMPLDGVFTIVEGDGTKTMVSVNVEGEVVEVANVAPVDSTGVLAEGTASIDVGVQVVVSGVDTDVELANDRLETSASEVDDAITEVTAVDDGEAVVLSQFGVVGGIAAVGLEIHVEVTAADDGEAVVLSQFALVGEDAVVELEMDVEVTAVADGVAVVLSQFGLTGEDAVMVLDIVVEVATVDVGIAVVLSQFGISRGVATVETEFEADVDKVNEVAVVLSLSLSEFAGGAVTDGGTTVVAANQRDVEVDSNGSTKTVVTATEAVDDGVSVVLSQFKSLVEKSKHPHMLCVVSADGEFSPQMSHHDLPSPRGSKILKDKAQYPQKFPMF
ncbi:hypothetical protein MMC30_004042 [Trapelia coarctata]|nr:hypothetical protein [Trapelia coarctata]